MSTNSTGDSFVPASDLSLPTESELLRLLSILEAYLPYSLPLYRRLQFYHAHPSDPTRPPHAQIFHASAQDVGGPRINSSSTKNGEPSRHDVPLHGAKREGQVPWLAAHVELSRSGETQVWIFASWECPDQEDNRTDHQQPLLSPREIEARRCLLQSFFKFVYTHCVPLMPLAAPASFNRVKKLHGNHHPYSPSTVLLGSCSLTIRSLIPDTAVRRVDSRYLKYIFSSQSYEHTTPGAVLNTPETLPSGYRYGVLRHPQDLQLALDRTHIPRTVETLALLPSRAVFFENEPDPVAWGFLGIDASLSSLHTEQQHRGKKLAVSLAKELLRMQREHFKMSVHQPAGDLKAERRLKWGHADVSEDNLGSRRVMEKAGGRIMWSDCWVEVELERLFGDGGFWSCV